MSPTPLTLEHLKEATHSGGPSALTSRAHLAPAAGEEALIAPAKYAGGTSNSNGTYVFETRFVNGEPVHTVLVDSRTSAANRLEAALADAIADEHPLLSRIPRAQVSYSQANPPIEFTEIESPHRIFDAHFRLGTHDGKPVTEVQEYIDARNSTPANALPLFLLSPDTVLFGGWDSTRKSHQARFPAAVVGEIIGILADQEADPSTLITRRSGARIDPVAPSYALSSADLKRLASKLSSDASDKSKAPKKASDLLLGAIPPSTSNLDGIATRDILRTHVVSFSTLRQLRFGKGADGDAAIRALLAALAIDLLTRADAELVLRANAHLVEKEEPRLTLDLRYGQRLDLAPLSVTDADQLLHDAYVDAADSAGIDWSGQIFKVEGDPSIPGAADATKDASDK